LRHVFLGSGGVSQLTFAFALQFLEAGKTGLRGGEFDGGIFSGLGDPLNPTESVLSSASVALPMNRRFAKERIRTGLPLGGGQLWLRTSAKR